jgi:hypothetical protein
MTVPPFKPSRIVAEQGYRVTPEWTPLEAPRPVHLDQPSGDNFQRLVHEAFPETALFWWSGRSKTNGRGVLMAYLPGERKHRGFFLELRADHGWRETHRLGISERELALLLS